MKKAKHEQPISSDFLMLDVKRGRAQLRKTVQGGAAVPVLIKGVIDAEWSSDDGTSQEFSVRVTDLKVLGEVLPFAAVADLKIGDKIKTDGGFTCLKDGAVRTVRGDKDGLFIACKDGRHYLDGQIDGLGKRYVGIYKVANARR